MCFFVPDNPKSITMLKRISVPVVLFSVYALLTTTSSCTKDGSDTPSSDSVTLLHTIYKNGKPAQRVEYDNNKRVKSIYYYSLSDTATVNPERREDYQYNDQSQVSKEVIYSLRTGQELGEAVITYQGDTMYYAFNDGYNDKFPLLHADNVIRYGDNDTVRAQNNVVLTLDYELYTLKGNDLTKYNSFDYFKNQYYQTQYNYEEAYTYDTTINPLWPLMAGNPFFAWKFLGQSNRERLPFAFTLSKHNPLQMSISYATINLYLPNGVTFEYKQQPGTLYPAEQKWLDKRNNSVYTIYTYDYIRIP